MRLSALAIPLIAIALSTPAAAQTFSLSSTVASPSTETFNTIKFTPRQNGSSLCELNTVFVDDSGHILFCAEEDNPAFLNLWRAEADERNLRNYVYMLESYSFVGLGTTRPQTQLHIHGEGSILAEGNLATDAKFYWNAGRSSLQAGTIKGEPTGMGSIALGTGSESSGSYSSVLGGQSNRAWGEFAFIGGGTNNSAGKFAAIGGGSEHRVSGQYASITGGLRNQASGQYSSIAGGTDNIVTGAGSFIAGGEKNIVEGSHSFAGGYGVTVTGHHSFAWGDGHPKIPPVTAHGVFVIQTGKVGIGDIDPQTTFSLAPGATALADTWMVRMPTVQKTAGPIKDALDVVKSMNSRFYTTPEGKHLFGLDTAQLSRLQGSKNLMPIVTEVLKASYPNQEKVTAIDYSQIIPVLVEAIKQLETEVEALKQATVKP